MGAPTTPNAGQKSVGDDLARVLPSGKWYTQRHLVTLNFCLFSLILFCKKVVCSVVISNTNPRQLHRMVLTVRS